MTCTPEALTIIRAAIESGQHSLMIWRDKRGWVIHPGTGGYCLPLSGTTARFAIRKLGLVAEDRGNGELFSAPTGAA
ncbi:hypothetical protein [Yoonia sp.]|uniref:hypothetical protein n=1 Tax=Yoonia sp. TaxID=2212373 RepID=UPI002E0C2334|nr:hypothetical protein [Yoonia sp.]